MYAALELAEAARIDGHLGNVVDRQVNPFIAQRGIKFNIPLDARTPSYSDDSTSGQANIPEMWDMAFWTRFLDEMARHRYNVLSLWSLSPFPSLVKVPEYPKVALADVKRKTGAMFDATNQGRNMYDPSWPLETVRTMTIDEKIAFWRGVMQYARDRGIDVSVFTWNIFVYGTEGSGYGLTVDPRNATTKDYVRRSTRALFNTYPLLTAIGITSGENMGDLDDAGKEQWMWETYGLGVKDAMADAADPAEPVPSARPPHHADPSRPPGRSEGDRRDLQGAARQRPQRRRLHAGVQLQVLAGAHAQLDRAAFIFQNGWYDSMPAGKQTWLTVRNDDLYYLRWGDPGLRPRLLDAAAAAARRSPASCSAPTATRGAATSSARGRDAAPAGHREAVVLVHALGPAGLRAGDARTSASRRLSRRAFRRPVRLSSPAWPSTSKIVPLLNRFYWGYFDFMWYPEASWSQAGFVGVRELHHAEVPADARGRGRRDAAHHVGQGVRRPRMRRPASITPLEVAERLDRFAADGVQRIEHACRRRRSPSSRRPSATSARWPRSAATTPPRSAAPSSSRATRRRRTRRRTPGRGRRSRHRRSTGASTRALWSAQNVGNVFTRLGPTLVDMTAIQAAVDKDIPAPLPAGSAGR